ncbi:MAG TPA: PAS domain-containing protein [Hyphomonadaceae bacterium]|nr:PAS domain-containing protein [Hyphomonadaceae bacterium]HPN05942.1 PAS domain-containing protein [Hyphomonadaceae bacterium]
MTGSILDGGGETGAILRAIDWSSSTLGRPETWPPALASTVRAILDATTPAYMAWGPDQVAFYNDAHITAMGSRHPQALGRPTIGWWTDMTVARAQLERTLSNAEIVGLWEWQIKDDKVVADARFAQFYGVDPARAAVGAPIADFIAGVHPEDRGRLGEAIAASLASGQPFACEYRLLSDGILRHVLARGQPTLGENGKAISLAGATIDITPQREAELGLSQSEERYSTLFNSIDAGFCVIQVLFAADGTAIDYVFIETNPAFAQQTGLSNATGKRMRDLSPTHEQHWFDLYGEVARTGLSVRFEDQAEALGRWFDVHAFQIGMPGANLVAILFTDITETKSAELKLRASESQFRSLAQAMPHHVWTATPDGLYDWFNQRVYDYSGLSAGVLDGVGWTALVHAEDLPVAMERWANSLVTGRIYETEFRLRRSDGVYRWYIARAVPIRTETGEITRWVGTNTDIDDQRAAVEALSNVNASLETRVVERTKELMKAEEQLRQSQKMEAIGQLTGGIAHDFNNLMTGIISALSLVRRRLETGKTQDLDKLMSAASTSAQRAAALTHRLLAFSRQQSLDVRAVDIGELIQSMRFLLNQTLGEDIQVEVACPPDLWAGLTDANQLENAVLNLVINARDAMPSGGRMAITMANSTLAKADVKPGSEEEPGDYVEIAVSDTGEGMSADTLAKAFDPFFTTKPIGQGTGLGLSMVYGFVQQSGGHVRIESEVGKGTRVALYLPRSVDSVVDSPVADRGGQGSATGGETVLVVEDDPTVRLMVVTALHDWGYGVIQTASAYDAIPILRSNKKIDLLLTDVGLPSINGRQLAEIARQFRSDLRVLFMTGYAEKAALRGQFLDAGMDLITKPFTLDGLSDKMREILKTAG